MVRAVVGGQLGGVGVGDAPVAENLRQPGRQRAGRVDAGPVPDMPIEPRGLVREAADDGNLRVPFAPAAPTAGRTRQCDGPRRDGDRLQGFTKGGVDLVITPDAAFLADPDTKSPVTVDPSTSSLGNLFDTYVPQGETVDWSVDTELDLGNPGTKNADGACTASRRPSSVRCAS
ncbi:hypothetical protein [Streptomyces sp. NPDC051909]|uniref:hypothetical protein n=1 Tax=Streptomyces sp. NPDC051909 TaxID=3154944 RepID=UPI003429FC1E